MATGSAPVRLNLSVKGSAVATGSARVGCQRVFVVL